MTPSPGEARKTSQLRNDVDDIFNLLSDIHVTLDRHTTRLDQHSVTLAELTATLDQHAVTLAEHTATLDQHSATLAGHGGKLDRILEILETR